MSVSLETLPYRRIKVPDEGASITSVQFSDPQESMDDGRVTMGGPTQYFRNTNEAWQSLKGPTFLPSFTEEMFTGAIGNGTGLWTCVSPEQSLPSTMTISICRHIRDRFTDE